MKEIKNNEDKALEIAKKNSQSYGFGLSCDSSIECFNSAMQMAEWKDKQFQEEKKQLIEKACKEHCNCCGYAYMACRRYNYDNLHCRHYIKFKQAMEE